jgi:hypothetical protein
MFMAKPKPRLTAEGIARIVEIRNRQRPQDEAVRTHCGLTLYEQLLADEAADEK